MIQDNIYCPSCGRRALRRSYGESPYGEFFCDIDRNYFTVDELVNFWGYDVSDFINERGISLLNDSFKSRVVDTISMILLDGEPLWASEKERNEAYEVVNHMYQEIPKWDDMSDYLDLKSTQNNALGVGIQ